MRSDTTHRHHTTSAGDVHEMIRRVGEDVHVTWRLPVVDWTDAEVFELLRDELNEAPEGFSSCSGCGFAHAAVVTREARATVVRQIVSLDV